MKNRGYSLVELLIAAAILAVLILSVVALLRKSDELSSVDIHRRRARAVIDSVLEDRSFHYSNYQGLTQVSRQVKIDTREAGSSDDLSGILSVTVRNEKQYPSVNGISVPYKEVIVTVLWNEPEGPESITISKWITRL